MTIRVKNLNFFYGSSQALFDINLEANEGDTVVLLGPSGAGKSTLIRTLNLLEVPKSGELSIANNDFNLSNAMANPKAIRQLRQDVGMVFQQYHLWPHLTVIENLIEAPMKVRGVSENEAKADAMELLKRLRLEQLADRFPLHLSGGQQQRVAIARALMMKPQVLLFDEPTAALDPEITAQVVDIIKELQETGITQVIVTHEVNVAQKVATKVVYMEQGKIVEIGSAYCFENPKTEQFKQYLSH
ncbi:arginine ABC transporter ATP-binding protein ArtP [Haemophilus haemolyticus]|uniref:arginine ABC transporter ATP-binding protein ArtP n=1 Tax=Haemophilus haemolyticus TaxID=726 RepID=UPI003D808EDA